MLPTSKEGVLDDGFGLHLSVDRGVEPFNSFLALFFLRISSR